MSLHRYENELALRQSVDADISELKRLLDELKLKKKELSLMINTLNEDKLYLKKFHSEVIKRYKLNAYMSEKPGEGGDGVFRTLEVRFRGLYHLNRHRF